MPEGHTVHRTANHFAKFFAGQKVAVTSPQGRFSSDAKLVSGHTLVKSWAVGKQLFLEFDNDLTVRVHLGIYGKWQFDSTGISPDVVGQVRARFTTREHNADLRGPTACEVIDHDGVAAIAKRLGPDPLNPNPRGVESRRFIEKVRASKKPIALLLMNQDVISGVGNVYRAELLFRAGIEPHTPGNKVTEEQLQVLWDDAVRLFKVGVKTGFMITRENLFRANPSKDERNWVYKREGQACRVCGARIKIEIMATRKLYWCPRCQSDKG